MVTSPRTHRRQTLACIRSPEIRAVTDRLVTGGVPGRAVVVVRVVGAPAQQVLVGVSVGIDAAGPTVRARLEVVIDDVVGGPVAGVVGAAITDVLPGVPSVLARKPGIRANMGRLGRLAALLELLDAGNLLGGGLPEAERLELLTAQVLVRKLGQVRRPLGRREGGRGLRRQRVFRRPRARRPGLRGADNADEQGQARQDEQNLLHRVNPYRWKRWGERRIAQ